MLLTNTIWEGWAVMSNAKHRLQARWKYKHSDNTYFNWLTQSELITISQGWVRQYSYYWDTNISPLLQLTNCRVPTCKFFITSSLWGSVKPKRLRVINSQCVRFLNPFNFFDIIWTWLSSFNLHSEECKFGAIKT